MKLSFVWGAAGALLASFVFAEDLGNGLKIDKTRPGAVCSRKSRNGDTLTMNYRGTLESGVEFDSSYGRAPFSFKLGAGQVIKGWDLGLLDMCIGEARKLTIPPSLGYGSRDMGAIPPNSILLFDTELISIDGVTETPPSNSSSAGVTDPMLGSQYGPKHDEENNSECKLLGNFAIFVQAALGGLALLALVWKRWREHPRRPIKVWFFDVSKQVVGSFMVHFANVFLSMISSGHFELVNQSALSATLAKGAHGDHPNPCSFYLLNLGIDTTVGIPILVCFLRIFHLLFQYTPLSNPPESLKSGNYGNPPRVTWWLKQAIIYFLGLMAMKMVVFLLFQIFPWLGWIGDWALRWTEGKEWMQILFVMLIFPLIMNAAQYWIIDSFIKDPAGDYDYNPVEPLNDDDDDEENEGLVGGRRDSEEITNEEIRIQPNGGKVVAVSEEWYKKTARTKEPNPLPLPVEFDSEDEDSKPSSSEGKK